MKQKDNNDYVNAVFVIVGVWIWVVFSMVMAYAVVVGIRVLSGG